jgi:hypothetical protein
MTIEMLQEIYQMCFTPDVIQCLEETLQMCLI